MGVLGVTGVLVIMDSVTSVLMVVACMSVVLVLVTRAPFVFVIVLGMTYVLVNVVDMTLVDVTMQHLALVDMFATAVATSTTSSVVIRFVIVAFGVGLIVVIGWSNTGESWVPVRRSKEFVRGQLRLCLIQG